MSTLTPNYGLIVPDGTDTVEQVRADYATNLNTIDGIGGGGSGGHTIVNPSGTDMPAEGKLQFTGGVTVTDDSVNGKTVVDISGGGGNVYGAFIDPTRSLTSSIAFSNGTPINYTATEDCIVEIYNDSANALEYCVDGLAVYFLASGSYTMPLPLKKGQTLTSVSANSYSGAYHVYGLTQGTSGIFTPIIYSDTERVVGVWRDNKPLYQKTVYVGSISAGSGVSLAHNIANIDTIANYEGIGFNTVESRWNTLPRVDDDVTYQRGLAVGATNIVIWGASNVQAMTGVTVTIWYTKTTDVAGSGNWNTDGVPTVHYSTSEQVIGTWIDSKPIYRRTINFTTASSAVTVYNSGISDIKSIVKQDGFIDRGDGWYMPLNFSRWDSSPSDLIGTMIKNDGTVNVFINDAFYYGKDVYVTLDYTKTTD